MGTLAVGHAIIFDIYIEFFFVTKCQQKFLCKCFSGSKNKIIFRLNSDIFFFLFLFLIELKLYFTTCYHNNNICIYCDDISVDDTKKYSIQIVWIEINYYENLLSTKYINTAAFYSKNAKKKLFGLASFTESSLLTPMWVGSGCPGSFSYRFSRW